MTFRYIEVDVKADFFVPATRSFGDIAIVGALDTTAQGPKKTPVPITNPLAVSSSDVSLTTNAATPAANSTLHFAAVPAAVVPGLQIIDVTTGTAIPLGAVVQSKTDTRS